MTVISVIVGSIRQGRFSEKPALWILQHLKKRSGIEANLLDLRDFPMPFFDQPIPPAAPGRPPYEHEVVKKWTAEIARSDGVLPGHPLRKIRGLVRDVLKELSRSFARLYANDGRPSVPPEQLLSALLIQALYGIRSERQLMEQLNYNLLYRWFVGLSPDDAVWDATTFTKNRERLQAGEVFEKFMTRLLNHPQVRPLLSDQHFSVDGTLIEAWASQRSFRPKDGSDGDGSDFHGQTRKNDTHQSTTDPDSRLYRKATGREARLAYMGHVTMENRHGLAVAGVLSKATGTAERWASEAMLAVRRRLAGRRITVGEDKAYDTAAHVAKLRAAGITPHVTQNNRPTKTRRQRRRRDRCADHPSLRLRRVAVTPRDDRVHLWLGQTARHDAQDQAPRYPTRCR